MKKHKIIVTRDSDGTYCFWKYGTSLKKSKDGTWTTGTISEDTKYLDGLDYSGATYSKLLGFIPRKGSKQTITITRDEK
jgi:hypothetical protein